MKENELSYEIRGAAINVHKELGPGLLESVYEKSLTYELKKKGLHVENQIGIAMCYKEIKFDIGFRLDILVNQLVIVEIKSVDALLPVHYKQLLTYLKLTDIKLGLLINFNVNIISEGIFRIVNNL